MKLRDLEDLVKRVAAKPCSVCSHPMGHHGPLLDPGSCLSCRVGEGCGVVDLDKICGKPLAYHPPAKPEITELSEPDNPPTTMEDLREIDEA